MDVTQALRNTENSLRDFIAVVLQNKFGKDWIIKCGVTQDRIDKWNERKNIEEKRQESGAVEERLIYYADFYDLKTVLKKNWSGEFSETFGEWKRIEVFLDELERFRDADAHRRELLLHEKQLVLGIAGEVRARLIRYRSKHETGGDYFPRIESVRDSLGNIWTPGNPPGLSTKSILRPNDIVDYIVTASDPEDAPLEYGYRILGNYTWQKENTLSLKVSGKDIGLTFLVSIVIRSPRKYHAHGDHDDSVDFIYQVLPAKQEDK